MSTRAEEAAERRVSEPPDVVVGLERFRDRGAGTDSERRAARWLAHQLEGRHGEVAVESFWCRPNWALAQSWHVALAFAGSLTSVASPRVGGAMLLVALVFVIADAMTGLSPGRRLTPERASQNVVALPPTRPTDQASHRLRLIISANYDAGRTGLIYRDGVRSATTRVHRALRGFTPGWAGWLALDIAALLAVTILRLEGHTSTGVGAIQVLPTLILLAALALLLQAAFSEFSPAAGDNGSGVAVALSLARALRVSPPRHLDVELVLTGAGDGGGHGLHHHLSRRRKSLGRGNTVVIGVAACTGGQLRWWTSDGPLVPLRYASRLLRLARHVSVQAPELEARPHRGRGSTPALPARQARIPAITIGCLDERGLAPRSHRPYDLAAGVSRKSHDRAVQYGLMLVDEIDAAVGSDT
jgi:Peptidase family M28